MGRRVKKSPAPEDVETKAKLSSKCQKAKSRNTASEHPMAADDNEVDGKKSKVRKVKTRIVTRKRKTAHDDGSCDIHGHVTNTAEFEPSPVNPDCISPATKLAKQFKCFKQKQISSLASGGDSSVASSTTARARKRRGNAVQKKCLNAALPRVSFNTVSSACSSPTDVANNADKSCSTKTGGKNGKNEDGSTNACSDSKIVRKGRTNTRGDRTVVTRKRPAKRKVDTLVERTDAAKTTKRSCVDNKTNKSQRKARLGKRQADVVCGPSDVSSTGAAPTGEGNVIVSSSAAGPSREGDTEAGSSNSESDWEEVDGNISFL